MAKTSVSPSEILWMSVVAILIPAVILIGALIYVAFYTSGYSLFQQIVIIIVALIVVAVAEAILWMAWAAKKGMMHWHGNEYKYR
ncbi:MAG: hypothetical protein KGH72_04575 [Candidatus Micrarchaeota archaeon]|nr:hypothetical protein [Candidatus Micrarchaeota archaeon]